ncbi:MAG: glutamine-hydrolyzing carbamoyl-phosphate synthase small subunit [Deltaproteobacteria bacterium]|nr:glutamine-hydrolyzing carbamoyl-phosphate synthase small subunit [Deltaproteobacteria bacterium]MBW2068794.1 glutamine-hydrolyzing carbamoyl-phosphate synthase small subunit [Deltaproteobacteria bacterium]
MTYPWERPPALLVLEDGTVFRGRAFVGHGRALGEVVFNTGMTGYQEVLTDPSYKGQIVTMTYTQVGNYGINSEDMESNDVQVEAFIIKEYQDYPSNWRSEKSLADFLADAGKIGIEGVDTRALTRHIRLAGAMKGVIATDTDDIDELLEQVRAFPGLIGIDMVRRVTCSEPYLWLGGKPRKRYEWDSSFDGYRIAAFDFGVKYNILRNLERRGCQILVFPASTEADEILSYNPDGIFLSNGPGDPAAVTYAINTVRELLGKKPMFGICLGHQLIALALGGSTYKLKFGHRGINQPVKDLSTGKIEITSQNHGFCVDLNSLDTSAVKLTHLNLNDETLEGLEHKDIPVFSVQYHPEAAPGPHDASYLFDRFIALIDKCSRRTR